MTIDPSVAECPACASAIVVGDAFCEGCGAVLPAGPAVLPGAAGDDPIVPGRDRSHLVVPSEVRDTLAGACHMCGSPIADDGFCASCGMKARSPRDHWTETPAAWLGGVCDKGIDHARNEDAMALACTPDVAVLVVCDGVTTAPESDRASLAASKASCALLAGATAPVGSFTSRLSQWQPLFEEACSAANAETVAISHALGDPTEPPSCTFVAGVVAGDLVAVAWCGDSRAYWLDDDPAHAVQLSTDHSLGTDMIRAGMSRQQAEAEPTCHTITRWLGADSIDPTCEYRAMLVERPGWLAVVSDGMWNYASSPSELLDLIGRAEAAGATTPTAIAESLAAFANECGGHDNITVALARCAPQLPSREPAPEPETNGGSHGG